MHATSSPRADTGLLVFRVDAGRYALPLDSVERIVRAAAVTPLPLAPHVISGVIDIGGKILPVFDLRDRFRLPPRALMLDDQFIIARTSRRTVVLVVDAALGVIERADAPVPAREVAPDLAHLRGILSLPDGLVLIQDLERFLSPGESNALESAMRAEEARRAR